MSDCGMAESERERVRIQPEEEIHKNKPADTHHR